MLANNTGDRHIFQLPQPLFRWTLRLDTANLVLLDRAVEALQLEVDAHSVQLLTAVVEAPGRGAQLHAPADSAVQPEKAPRPQRPAPPGAVPT